MKNKLLKILVVVLIAIVLILGVLLYINYKKYNTPYIKTITIFKEEVKILPNVYVYDVHIKSASINKVNNGCELPYTFEVNDIYKQKYKETGVTGNNYVVDGEDYAYFHLNFENYDIEKGETTRIDARYYFNVTFDNPLEVDEFCQNNE